MADGEALRDRYLTLLTESVNGSLHPPTTIYSPVTSGGIVASAATSVLRRIGMVAAYAQAVPESAFATGDGWPSSRLVAAESMAGRARLVSLRQCVESLLADGVPGDLIETGVWRGGACILMRGVLAAWEATDRKVYVADSFEGLPAASLSDDAAYLHDDSTLAVGLDAVKANFDRYGLLDDQVVFTTGWFKDSLPPLRGHNWSLVRLDGDMYESTKDAITALYPDLSVGGYLIVDDYRTYESCRRAIDEYRAEHGVEDPFVAVDRNCVYWRKGSAHVGR
jgi:Macrocin-O-methyltransferase (TylF)